MRQQSISIEQRYHAVDDHHDGITAATHHDGSSSSKVGLDGMTSVFNTDASLPYNHDLLEGLIVKKRINIDGERTYCWFTTIIPRCLQLQTIIQAIWVKTDTKIALTSVGSHILQRPQPGAVGITRSPSWKAISTDSTRAFRNLFHTPLPSQSLATSLLTSL
ncbi:hypothetical protein CSKR_106797 [Clonorchis sinensis]|uniref:Uncharacterized protein n=1 Tax=Clonorchis sinensis TaxID=79923 RepID=A0A419PUE8_CLOSI|nr:hypothetical protein CSKR_106797 [Clonorchis sinensis]